MDLGKLIDLLQQYPSWYRTFIVLWVVAGAILAGGLVFFRSETRPTPSAPTASAPPNVQPSAVQESHPVSATLPSSAAPTAQTYFTTLRALSERFLEKQEFIERNSGAVVEWAGLVDGVSQTSSKKISLHLTVEGIQPERTVYTWLPESLRTKAFSLQKGDLVRVKGKLSLPTPNLPDLDATELTLVRPRGAS